MNDEDAARQAEGDWSGPGWYEVVYTVDGAVYCDNTDVDCDPDAELIRYTLVVMPAKFVDHGTYTTVTMTFGDVPLYTHTVLVKGKRCTSKRNFEATGMLQKALRRWLYEN